MHRRRRAEGFGLFSSPNLHLDGKLDFSPAIAAEK